jgi:hypothetical protein
MPLVVVDGFLIVTIVTSAATTRFFSRLAS